jgi:hypothetical protein
VTVVVIGMKRAAVFMSWNTEVPLGSREGVHVIMTENII